MTLRKFWHESTFLPRAAVTVAVVSLAFNLGTYLGLRARGALAGLYALHIIVMLLVLATFLLTGYANLQSVRGRTTDDWETLKPPLPSTLVWLAIGGAAYVVAMLAYAAITLGEGGLELQNGRHVWVRGGRIVRELGSREMGAFERFELRLFSAAWLFFAVVVALWSHRLVARLRWIRTLEPSRRERAG